MKKNSYDFDFSSDQNNKKNFTHKLQNERKQRLEAKKLQSSAKTILFHYRQSVLYLNFSSSLIKDYNNKLQDLLKLEVVLKEKFCPVALAALEKYQLLKVCLVITQQNSDKFIGLLENLSGLLVLLCENSEFLQKASLKRKILLKRLAFGLLGVLLRGNKGISEKGLEFLAIFSKIKGLEINEKLILSLLKAKSFEKSPIILTKVFKKLIKSVLMNQKAKKEAIIYEIMKISNGVTTFLPKKTSFFLENLINQLPLLLKNLQKIPKTELVSFFENLICIFSIENPKESSFENYCFLFLKAFNQILDFLTETQENSAFDQNSEMIEKGTMEIELNTKNFICEVKPKALEIFYSDDFISFITKKMSFELENKQIFISQDWDFLRNVSHLYTTLFQIKSPEKSRFLIKLSFSTEFIEMLFSLFETFNFKIFQHQIELFADIINLFSRLYHQKIILMDEMEFYSQFPIDLPPSTTFLRNFPMEKILSLSLFLNNFVFQSFFLEQQKSFTKCKHSTIKLLKELYNRHSLRKFTKEPLFWTIPQASLLQASYPQILKEIPFILPFEARIVQLNKFLLEDKSTAKRDDNYDDVFETVTIRRGYEIEDGFAEFPHLTNLRNMIRIKYMNEHGLEEIGIDGGGLLKEYLCSVCKKAFDPNYGLFIETDERTLRPNPHAEQFHSENSKELLVFLGKIVGKALYENILIEPVFSRSFLNGLLGRKNVFNDLGSLDKALYKSLLFLKHAEDKEMIKQMGLTFSLVENCMGKQDLIELKENGANIDVTRGNKLEFIQLLVDYKLNKQTQNQVNSFLTGFRSVIQTKWLTMFNQDELQILISGSKGFDVKDLKANCVLKGFHHNDLTLHFLWETLENFNSEEKQMFLFFVTSCSRPPLLGFGSLKPLFCIQKADYGGVYFGQDESDRLPTSSTCMNILRLPDYMDDKKLKAKLLYAISAKSGFELS